MMPLRRALARLRVRLAAARVARAGSLREVQRFAMRLHAARPALVTPTVAWDWVELGDQVLRLAAAWRAAGIGKGARVATLLSDEWPQLVVRLAGIETGVVLVGFTPAHPPAVLAQALMHPSHEVNKTYLVKVPGIVPQEKLDQLRLGVKLEDGPTAPAIVNLRDYDHERGFTLFDITIHEGRNRQIRRMCDAIGFPVRDLKRIKLGPLQLSNLGRGKFRSLSEQELSQLRKAAKL